MRIAAMLDQREEALITPLSLKNVDNTWPQRFKRPFDQNLIRALLDVHVELDRKDSDKDPNRSFRVAAGLDYVTITNRFINQSGALNGFYEWLQLRGEYISFWLCAALHDGSAMYWYRSHYRFTVLRFMDLHDRFTMAGYDGLNEMIATEVSFSLLEKRETLAKFELSTLEFGVDQRIKGPKSELK